MSWRGSTVWVPVDHGAVALGVAPTGGADTQTGVGNGSFWSPTRTAGPAAMPAWIEADALAPGGGVRPRRALDRAFIASAPQIQVSTSGSSPGPGNVVSLIRRWSAP